MRFIFFVSFRPNEISTTTSVILCSDSFLVIQNEFSAKWTEHYFPLTLYACGQTPFSLSLPSRPLCRCASAFIFHPNVCYLVRSLMDFGFEIGIMYGCIFLIVCRTVNIECKRPLVIRNKKCKAHRYSTISYFEFFTLTELFYPCMCCVCQCFLNEEKWQEKGRNKKKTTTTIYASKSRRRWRWSEEKRMHIELAAATWRREKKLHEMREIVFLPVACETIKKNTVKRKEWNYEKHRNEKHESNISSKSTQKTKSKWCLLQNIDWWLPKSTMHLEREKIARNVEIIENMHKNLI